MNIPQIIIPLHFYSEIKFKLISMTKPRILFVFEEIYPYLSKTHISKIGRYLPQATQEKKKEIRTFLPRYGKINERRNQLHEVIRLSGMNLIINDIDHPLIIKVASIQLARMQVYFIDNEDYFHRKHRFRDKDRVFFNDNDERAIFYARGVLETVKKLNWSPDLIHIHGWFGSLVAMYVKKIFKDNPLFNESKVVISIYNNDFTELLSSNFPQKLLFEGINIDDLKHYNQRDFVGLMKSAIDFSDAVIFGEENLSPDVTEYALNSGKPVLVYHPEETYLDAYNEFYDQLLAK